MAESFGSFVIQVARSLGSRIALADEELGQIIDKTIAELNAEGMQAMGQVIGSVKQQTAGQADGGRIAQMVKERLVQ